MASSSPMQFILDTVIQALQAEPSFNVVRIWRADAYESNRITVYPYISTIQYTNMDESGYNSGYARAALEVMCSALVPADVQGAGKSSEVVGDIAMKVKHALESFNCDTHPSNVDVYYTTRIAMMMVDGHIGNYNVGDNRVQLGVAATIYFGLN